MMGATSYTIGVDVGGTHTRVGLVDVDGALADARKWRTPSGAGGRDLLDRIADAISTLAASGRAPTALGLAVPGALDDRRSKIVRAVNLPFLQNVPLGEELSRRTGLPVVIETDVAAAAWGEYAAGWRQACRPGGRRGADTAQAADTAAGEAGTAAQRPPRFVFVGVGTGIGAAAILDGQIVRHTHGGAGHVGQMIVDASDDAPLGRCGGHGTLEAAASGPALERAAEASGLPASLVALEQMCQAGDTNAIGVVSRAARFLAVGLVNVACLYAPDEIVVGGGAAGALPQLVTRAAADVRRLGGDMVPPTMIVRPTYLGDDAGVVGVALLAAAGRTDGSP